MGAGGKTWVEPQCLVVPRYRCVLESHATQLDDTPLKQKLPFIRSAKVGAHSHLDPRRESRVHSVRPW